MVDRLANTEINARRIQNVESCFGSFGDPLVKKGRVLVGEGVLRKLCRKKIKTRQFFLFNDIMVYGNIIISKKRYNKQHILDLRHVRIEEIPCNSSGEEYMYDENGEQLKHGWLVISPSKTFAVYAESAVEKEEWITHMTQCIQVLKKNFETDDNLQCAPRWIPDNEAPECMRCHRVKFSTIQRRHHCRKCGFVVCNDCSTHRIVIISQSPKPLRVCDTCYKES